jgi:hypothetical protein
MRVGSLLSALVVLAFGCTTSGGASGEAITGPYADRVVTDPAWVRAEPDVVAPGTPLEVHSRGGSRGPGFVLERETADGWLWEWALSSDPDSDPGPLWSAEEFRGRGIVWNDGPAFDGVGNHTIPVPDVADPGRWRVCTAPDLPARCAEFEVLPDA